MNKKWEGEWVYSDATQTGSAVILMEAGELRQPGADRAAMGLETGLAGEGIIFITDSSCSSLTLKVGIPEAGSHKTVNIEAT